MSALNFELHDKQIIALTTDATEVLYGGSAGSGKSYLMRAASIIWATSCPGIQIYLFRRTRGELSDNHMTGPDGYRALLSDGVRNRVIKINETDYEIKFKNGKSGTYDGGSVIHLCHCQYEKNVYEYQGAEIHVLMIDELTHFTKFIYEFLRSRVRISKKWKPPDSFVMQWGHNFFPRILCGTNPGGPLHSTVKKWFIDIAPPFEKTRMTKKEGGMLRQFIPAKLADNPDLDYDEYEGKLMGMSDEAYVRALLEGDWNFLAGGMFDDVYVADTHVITPFEIPSSWHVDRSFDWGSSDPFSVGWWAQSDGSEVTLRTGEKAIFPKGTLFRIAELYGQKPDADPNTGCGWTAFEVGQGIAEMEKTHPILRKVPKVHQGPADGTIWNTSMKYDSRYISIAQEINSGYYGDLKRSVFDIFVRADRSQGSRIRGWELIRTSLRNSSKYPRMEEKGLFFFSDCHAIIRTLPLIERSNKNREDIKDGQEDHALDEVRYRVAHVVFKSKKLSTRMK